MAQFQVLSWYTYLYYFFLQILRSVKSLNPSAVFTTKLLVSAAAGLTYHTGIVGPHFVKKSLKELRHTDVLS